MTRALVPSYVLRGNVDADAPLKRAIDSGIKFAVGGVHHELSHLALEARRRFAGSGAAGWPPVVRRRYRRLRVLDHVHISTRHPCTFSFR